jgi:hypothetical protein
MRVAAMLAAGAGTAPDITHYKAAWARLSTTS